MQTARSAALDGGALSVMAVDAAIATITIGIGGTHHFWIVALALLGLSLLLAVGALRLPGAEQTGPSVAGLHDARDTQDDSGLEDLLFEGLAEDVRTNQQALARIAPLFNGALAFLMLAIVIELVGRLQ
ncbi:MAG TPA: hypothetical protein VII53_08970 [Solirubrobacteraceae bacterium]